MKKILLATTAAICAGGVASAEVSLSGEGKLGLSYKRQPAGSAENEWGVISSANVKFTLSGETDNEMIGEYGASFTLDADEELKVDSSGEKGTLTNPFIVYVGSAAGPIGRIEAGSDLTAGDKKSGGLGDPGLDGLGVDDVAEAYFGKAGPAIRYDKELADAAIAVSIDLEDSWSVGAEYAISETLTIGAGYDRIKAANDLNTLSVGVIGELGQVSGGFLFSSRSTTVPANQTAVPDKSAFGVEFGYSLGDTKFSAIYARNDEGANGAEQDAWGVGITHDLGGGLSFKGGYGDVADVSKANFGFLMAF